MGLSVDVVDALIREHRYKPIAGDVVVIGKQTIYLQPHEILDLLREHHIDVSSMDPRSIEIDRITEGQKQHQGQDLISDAALFRLLGVPKIRALDHSDYEGADIIHDLTKPLPDRLKGVADFIVDGSTLDNVFNPALAIRNLVELLRPGGRFLSINMYSNHNHPYVLMHPLWYLDYFVINGFVDCKVYITAYGIPDPSNKIGTNAFCINTDYLLDDRWVGTFVSPYVMGVIVLAEKGANSTTDMFPSQQHYRSTEEWETYRKNLMVIKGSDRPHLVRTRGDMVLTDVAGGHLFMGSDFTARDPSSEMQMTERPVAVAREAVSTTLRRIVGGLLGRSA